MGVKFDRVFDEVNGPLKEIQGLASPLPGTVSGTAAAGYLPPVAGGVENVQWWWMRSEIGRKSGRLLARCRKCA